MRGTEISIKEMVANLRKVIVTIKIRYKYYRFLTEKYSVYSVIPIFLPSADLATLIWLELCFSFKTEIR